MSEKTPTSKEYLPNHRLALLEKYKSLEEKTEKTVSSIKTEQHDIRVVRETGTPESQKDAQAALDSSEKQIQEIYARLRDIEKDKGPEEEYNELYKRKNELEEEHKRLKIKQELESVYASLKAVEKNKGPEEEYNELYKRKNELEASLLDVSPVRKEQSQQEDGLERKKSILEEVNTKMTKESEREENAPSQPDKDKESPKEETPEKDRKEVESVLKSIAWMKGKNSMFTTPSMLARERSKMKKLVKEGKIDRLEAEILMQDAEKGKIEKALGSIMGKVVEKNRDWKENSWFYRNIVSVPEYNKKWKRFVHRAGRTVAIGGILGALGAGAGIAMASAAGIGAGYSLTRMIVGAGAGIGARELHKGLTKKGVNEKISKVTNSYKTEAAEKLAQDILVPTDGSRKISARDRDLLRSLRKQREDGSISAENKIILEKLEAARKEHMDSLLRSRDNYKELVHRIRGKNERNSMLWSTAAGLLVGFGSAFALPRAEVIDIIDQQDGTGGGTGVWTDPGAPENVPVPHEDLTPTWDEISDLAKVREGDGISQIIKRQFDANPELAEKFGIKTGSQEEYRELMERMGYKDGAREIWLKGGDMHVGKDAYVPGINADGDPVIYEFKNGAMNPVEHQCFDSGFEDGKNFDNDMHESNEYIKDTSKIEKPNTPPARVPVSNMDYVIEEVTPQTENIPPQNIDYVVERVNPVENTPPQNIDTNYYSGPTPEELELERQKLELENEKIKWHREQLEAYRQMLEEKKANAPHVPKWDWKKLFATIAAADVFENGKFDLFGIFDKRGPSGGGGTTIPAEIWGPQTNRSIGGGFGPNSN